MAKINESEQCKIKANNLDKIYLVLIDKLSTIYNINDHSVTLGKLLKDLYNKKLFEYISWPIFRELVENYFNENEFMSYNEHYVK